jgi:hypothetical protein
VRLVPIVTIKEWPKDSPGASAGKGGRGTTFRAALSRSP